MIKTIKNGRNIHLGGVVLCFLQQICKIGFYYFSLKSVKIRFIMRGIEINT